MLDIAEVGNGYEVSFQYKPFLVDAIRRIPGARFRGASKKWFVPSSSGTALLNWARTFNATPRQQTPVEIGEIDPLPELEQEVPLKMNLFPYQRNGVAYAMQKKRVIVGDEPGLGKAQPLTSKLATPYGWILMGDAYVGMEILGADGNVHRIIGVYPQGDREVYKVTFNDGSSVECDRQHLWQVRDQNRRRRSSNWTVKTTEELISSGLKYRQNEARELSGRKQILKWEIPLPVPFDYEPRSFVIHPYILGALLGDGSICSDRICISIPDSEIETKERIEKLLPKNLKLSVNRHPACPQYFITQTGTTKKNPFAVEIERLGLKVKGNFKFIPNEYLFGAKEQRIEMLRGLMDTDGSAKKGRITFHTCSQKLAECISDLVFSLGGQAILREYDRTKEGKSIEWQVNIRIDICPFYMQRKVDQWGINKRNYASKYIESIEFVGIKPTQCIQVSAPDHLYLTDHFIVTHNTAQAIATMVGHNARCVLVICPATLRENWKREWKMWTGREALIITDRVKTTWMQYHKVGVVNVFICNYESLKKYFVEKIDKPEGMPLRLNHIKFRETINLFDGVIIDELHRCKDGKTQQSKYVMGICKGKEYVLGLTGTPVVNKPIDLISQLHIVGHLQTFGGYKNFVARYCDGYNQASNLKELNYLLNKHCFYRREKKMVLKDLPDKVRSIFTCEIENRSEYVKAENDLVKYLKENLGKSDAEITKSMRGEVMVLIGILKKISARGKINDVIEHVKDVVDAGEKIVVFAWHKEIVHELKAAIKGAVTVVGDDSMDERQRAVDSFQKDPAVKVIICNIKSGGVGITLTASSRVCFIELPWHPADADQCEDRCIVEGELVLTPHGWKPVESIRVGDQVINRYGNECYVVDVWSRGNTKLETQLLIEGWGSVRTTNDHRFLLEDGTWLEAEQLKPGNKLMMPNDSIGHVPELTAIPFDDDCHLAEEFVGNHGTMVRNGRLKRVSEEIEVSDDFLFMCGYFAGDGFASIKEGKGRFVSIAGNIYGKRSSMNRCKKWFLEMGLSIHERYARTGNGCEFRAYSSEWAYWFKKHFGEDSYTKRIPSFLLQLNLRQSEIVLSGLMASDGYYRNGRYEFISASNQLASQVFRLILRCGFSPTVGFNSTGQRVISYSLSRKGSSALVRSVSTYFPKKVNGARSRVYDITTDSSESFVVGSVVAHNCHRIGQKDSVQCTYFLGHQTIDEYIYSIIEKKRKIVNEVTGAEDSVETNMIDDFINLFRKEKCD